VSAAADNVISGDTDAYRAADAIVGSLAALQAPR
jgi:hypothetical protein